VRTGPEIIFSAPADDRDAATDVLDGLGVEWSARDDLGKVSVIGAGMKSHPGVAAKAFETLADAGIEPEVVTTSPIKIACHLRTDQVDKAVAVCTGLRFDTPEAERLMPGKACSRRFHRRGRSRDALDFCCDERGFDDVHAFASAR
jgi:aspartate kinase